MINKLITTSWPSFFTSVKKLQSKNYKNIFGNVHFIFLFSFIALAKPILLFRTHLLCVAESAKAVLLVVQFGVVEHPRETASALVTFPHSFLKTVPEG